MKVAAAAFTLAALGFGGCAQNPRQLAAATHGKEYFPSSIYGPASRRVVADGQPIPRGGGQYLVGRPYTVAGQTYYPSERRIVQVGNASWYGDAFHGRLTANGEIYDRDGFTAAHPTMPLPSYARVTNLRNAYSMIVRVNDRGPYASNRVMDVSRRVAEALDFKRTGTAKIKVEYVGRASLAGSDDARLYATLRINGPAPWRSEPTLLAEAQPSARVASLAPFVPAAPRPAPVARREERVPARSIRVAATAVSPRGPRERQEVTREEMAWGTFGRRAFPRETSGMATGGPAIGRYESPSRPLRLATRQEAPHLPIRELLTPPRPDHFSRGAPIRTSGLSGRGSVPPPPERIDLATIPGAASQIGPRHVGLRLARSHDY